MFVGCFILGSDVQTQFLLHIKSNKSFYVQPRNDKKERVELQFTVKKRKSQKFVESSYLRVNQRLSHICGSCNPN